MTVTYQREVITIALKQECQGLLHAHYVECGPPSWDFMADKVPLEPNWERYESLERDGAYHILTCRDGDALVGYAAWFITRNIHYEKIVDAANDIFFIAPDYRRGALGIKLFTESERMLREFGVRRIGVHIKTHNGLEAAPRKILERLGYVAAEINMWKVL